MMLWVDDVRTPPAGWHWVRSVNEAKNVLSVSARSVTHISLDHDLGVFAADGGDASKLTDWMAFKEIWPSKGIRVHSSNPVGVATMLATIDRYGPFPIGAGSNRGQWRDVNLVREF